MKLKIAIRDALPEDYGFIVHAGRKELALAEVFSRDWEQRAHNVLAALFDAAVRGGFARVACDADSPDTLVGFALYGSDRRTLLWLYVSHAFRGQRIAERLTGPTTEVAVA